MKSRIMTLTGHYGSPLCKYEQCSRPIARELVQTFESIEELLARADNCGLLEKQYDKKKSETLFLHADAHFIDNDYIYYKANVRNYRPMAMPDMLYLLAMMTDKDNPVVAVNIVSEQEIIINDTINQIIETCYIPSGYPQCEWHTYDLMDINKDSIKDNAILQIKELKAYSPMWH